jgi:predicted NBD/HSP70 family sugar kinase
MRADERPNELHTALARMAWDAAPSVRLHYDHDDDALVVEFAQADEVTELLVAPHLLLDLDRTGPAGRPVRLYLTGARGAPGSPSAELARDLVGDVVWAAARALVAQGTGSTVVSVGPEQAQAHRERWRSRSGRWTPAVIGVEFTPGRLYSALTNDRGQVLDEIAIDLAANDPDSVVEGIALLAGLLGARHPRTAAASCPIAVQLGGPVHTASGMVEHYDKPLLPGEEPWTGVPLGRMIHERTGRTALVFNDARAFAEYEIAAGACDGLAKVVVMIVRHGVGAKLVHRGRVVEDFPLEFGIFIDEPVSELDGERRSIEARAGITAIMEGVERATGRRIGTIAEAADEADRSDAALDAFSRAGRVLARGIAAVHAVIDPDRWILIAPDALLDGDRAAGRAFQRGLRAAHEHLGYASLWPSLIVPRSSTGSRGAATAAVVALARFGQSSQHEGLSPLHGAVGVDHEQRLR